MKIISKNNENDFTFYKYICKKNREYYASVELMHRFINKQVCSYYIDENYLLSIISSELFVSTQKKYREIFIKYLLDNKLFDKDLYDKYKIFTNADLQYSYKTECKNTKKKCEIDERYLLINIDERINNGYREDDTEATPPLPNTQTVDNQPLPPSRAINIEDFGNPKVERTCENCFSCKKLDNGTMRCTYDLHKKAVFAGETCRD